MATFYNFNPALVAAVIRRRGRSQTRPRSSRPGSEQQGSSPPGRVDLDAERLAEATDIAGQMIAGVGDAGRPLAAGNRATPEPDEPWERLWQRITILREWRDARRCAGRRAG